MIKITLPDQRVECFEEEINGFQLANHIKSSIAKKAIAITINDNICDLSTPIKTDATIKIITIDDTAALNIIRHDAAHILAEAVKELYPDVKVTIGPTIENGFYYDFDRIEPFSLEELSIIEEKMQEINRRKEVFIKEIWSRNQAIDFFKNNGEPYKIELLSSIPENEKITIYKQGNFTDLCRGPHGPNTGMIKHIKLLKVAGAYWRGDNSKKMLQRIYGTAWATKEQLDNYLFMLEEAKKRDHRKIGKELKLFHFQDEAKGMVFWHDHGFTIYRIIENYIRNNLKKDGYIEVKTPMLVDKKLWELSGHWEKFKENMYVSQIEDEIFALKPMNCPCHVQIFKQSIKSYRDLPLRMAEFGSCHRYEPSGALYGLMRVRGFVQDDAHIFCSEDQINEETIKYCKLLQKIYTEFGFHDFEVKFSDRPKIRAGTDEVWDKAENALKKAVEIAKLPYSPNPGDGAFYGPKLDFILRDAIGRYWQCGTLQVDLILPERLNIHYINANGEKERPVMMHRTIIGSLERFIGILLEHHSGKLPLWLAPIQILIATITNEVDSYVKNIEQKLIDQNIRYSIDISNEKINYKIHRWIMQKIPLIIIIGKKEMMEKTVNLRYLDNRESVQINLENLVNYIINNK